MSFQIPCATKHLDVAISDTGLDPAYLAVAYCIETETLPGALHAPVERLLPALRASALANPPAAQDHKLSEGKAHICLQQREEAAEARRCDPRAAGQAGPGLASRGCSLGVARAGRRSPPKTSRRRAAEPSAQGSGGRYGGGGGAERAAGGGG
jgi:hypothetical protein